MNRYYFHLWTGRAYEKDDIGIELESVEAACLEAFHGAQSVFLDLLRQRRDMAGYRFDVFDEQGRCLHEVSFAEALGQRVAKKPAQLDCVGLVNRGYALAADLAREITLVQENLRASRELIAPGPGHTKR